jgi:hypothetical protein
MPQVRGALTREESTSSGKVNTVRTGMGHATIASASISTRISGEISALT